MENFDISRNMRASASNAQAVMRAENVNVRPKPEQATSPEPVEKKSFVETKAAQALSVDNVEKAIESANGALKNANNSLRFQIDKSVSQPIISVVDQDSGKILRQYPSEEAVRISRNIDSLRGVLFDSRS